MKKRKYKVISFYNLIEKEGLIFNSNGRQFGICHESYSNFIHVVDLYTGGCVLKFHDNDILRLTDNDIIEFVKLYVSKITPEQWKAAEQKALEETDWLKLPANPRYRIS